MLQARSWLEMYAKIRAQLERATGSTVEQ